MSLRLKSMLLLVAMVVCFTLAQFFLHLRSTRASVREETVAANAVATHLLGNLMQIFAGSNESAIIPTLRSIGRVRSNELRLLDHAGNELYRSPPSPYKAGREAPQWYAALVRPDLERTELQFANRTLVIEADPDRSVLDGWDQAVILFVVALSSMVLGILVLMMMVRRSTAPFERIADGLVRMRDGHYDTRLPLTGGVEARAISEAFNRMAEAVQASVDARREASEARQRLDENRELSEVVQSRLEAQRRHISRELHDESAQGLTAIRSMATALAGDGNRLDGNARDALALIAQTASRLHDSLHAMVRRLRPAALEREGLDEALREHSAQWREEYPEVAFKLDLQAMPHDLGERHTLAVYRLVQEAVVNALRHGRPGQVSIRVVAENAGVRVQVDDDGSGLAPGWDSPGRYGIRGMRERAEALGGRLHLSDSPLGGVRVEAWLPSVDDVDVDGRGDHG